VESVAPDVGDLDNSRKGAQIRKVASEDDHCSLAYKIPFLARIMEAVAKNIMKGKITVRLNSGIASVLAILISRVE